MDIGEIQHDLEVVPIDELTADDAPVESPVEEPTVAPTTA